MVALTNVVAAGVNSVEWLAEAVTTIAVPVYQRHYRWDVDRCSRLLEDIRAVADADERQTHFIGSILATADTADAAALTLIDGQQRITTLMLLAAALHNTVKDSAAVSTDIVHFRARIAVSVTERPHPPSGVEQRQAIGR